MGRVTMLSQLMTHASVGESFLEDELSVASGRVVDVADLHVTEPCVERRRLEGVRVHPDDGASTANRLLFGSVDGSVPRPL